MDFNYCVTGGSARILGLDTNETTSETVFNVTVPAEINGVKVESIGANAFFCEHSLKTVIILNGIAVIGTQAFKFCENLEWATIPESVRKIEKDAFFGCKNVVLKVHENSYAHNYAVNENMTYMFIKDEKEQKCKRDFALLQEINSKAIVIANIDEVNEYLLDDYKLVGYVTNCKLDKQELAEGFVAVKDDEINAIRKGLSEIAKKWFE